MNDLVHMITSSTSVVYAVASLPCVLRRQCANPDVTIADIQSDHIYLIKSPLLVQYPQFTYDFIRFVYSYCAPFQFLAFKSDVDFWRRNKSLRGLSVRALFMEVVFQTVILFSLIEEDASLLVTVPAGVGVLIQVRGTRGAGFLCNICRENLGGREK